jgi:hypothetical protein
MSLINFLHHVLTPFPSIKDILQFGKVLAIYYSIRLNFV